MTTVLIIDDETQWRDAVRAVVPPDWTILEASDGLTGVDLVRQHYRELDLVVLDMALPQIEGRVVGLRIREIRADLPILPYTAYARPLSAMQAIGCLEPVYKPAPPEQLAAAISAALKQPMPPLKAHALVAMALEHSELIEQLVRQQHAELHVVVFAESQVKRAGLAHIVAPLAQVSEAAHGPALDLLLRRLRWTAVVADAAAMTTVLPLSQEYRVPLILIAGSAAEARAVTNGAIALVLLDSDPALSQHLADALHRLAAGGQPVPVALPLAAAGHRRVMPAQIAQHWSDTTLSVRELDVIWLDYQGFTTAQIAHTLTITPLTVGSHWRNIAHKLGVTRQQAPASTRALVRARINEAQDAAR
jgi:DNA-binding NarL/FixJ family response regulator